MTVPSTHEKSSTEAAEVAADEALTESEKSQFELVLRDRMERREQGMSFRGHSIQEQVLAALETDVSQLEDPILDWTRSGTDELACVDIDVPPDGTPLDTDVAVDRYFPTSSPQPLVAFRSHHGGLKAIFVAHEDYTAVQLAGAWVLVAPLGPMRDWRVELKSDCRHPRSVRVDPDGSEVRCGPVRIAKPASRIRVPEHDGGGVASEQDIAAWLERRGLSYGRYSTEACPLPGCQQLEKTSGSDPVVVSERGLRCYRCERFASWDVVAGGAR